jgi:aminoglycoside phosphotransferase (APT) family kinase protein
LSERENNQIQDFRQGAQAKMHAGEIDIDISLVRRLLREQFPHLSQYSLTAVRSTGTVNEIYRLGDELCVRLPRLEAWAESMDNEWSWLPKLAPHLSLRIPQPIARGEPAGGYPCPWAIYRWIEGIPYQDDLICDERQAAQDLAHFILELRGVDSQGAPHGGRPPLAELDAETSIAIESSRGAIDTETASAAWRRCLEAPAWDGKPVWIHGDLLKSNLLLQDGRLNAVIDFGEAGIGDPAADVVPAWSVFNKAGRETFRQVLDVDDAAWSRARGYALHQALMIIPYYPDTNPEFVTMAKRTVEEILTERD